MASGNPALNAKTFEGIGSEGEPMTIAGTINKTAILLAVTIATAGWCWGEGMSAGPSRAADAVMPYVLVGSIGGLLVAFLTIWKKEWARYTAVLYAALEGLAIGAVSMLMEQAYPGIAMQAAGLTFAVFVAMLVIYRSGLIPITAGFKAGVVAGTAGIALLYLVDLALMFFGKPISFIHEGGTWGIVFSLLVVGMAALNLVLDFDFIDTGVREGAPRYFEWYAAFGLMVTLIWLYLEILRLLGKSRK